MKKLLTLITAVFISINLFAQAPQKMSYQAVIRNASNNLVTNAPVKMRISILQGSTSGNAVYSELHSSTTNANGLVSIEIGVGTSPTGTFSSINWGNGTYFLKTETDPTGGNNYSITGTSQLLSVPYALNANCVELSVSPVGDSVKIGCSSIILPGATKSNFEPKIKNGLVGYWPFNGNANDESGNGNNGVVNGTALTSDRFGNPNSSYSFNGSSNYIQVLNSSSLQTPNAISINVWVNFQSGGTQSPRLMSKGWSPNGIEVHSNSNTNNKVSFGGGFDGVGYSTSTTTNCTLNQWYMITAIDNGNVKYIYVNGVLENSFTHNYNAIPINSIDLFFGKNSQNNTDYLSGKLDDIRIYNRALTQEEITYLYNN